MLVAMYTDRTAELAMDGATMMMNVDGGTCQGALLAPRLFSYFIFVIFEIWMQRSARSFSTLQYTGYPAGAGRQFNLSLFNVADDTAVLFKTREELELHGLDLISLLEEFGMNCHKATTESIAAGEAPKTAILHIKPQGPAANDPTDRSPVRAGPNQFIPLVESYVYLGALLHETLTDIREIQQRIQKANCYYGFLRRQIFGCRTTRRSTKKLMYEGMVMAILLYGSESWIISKKS
jgi:hypothetical protein